MFEEVVHNFGIYIVKNCFFPLDAYVVSCPTQSKKSRKDFTVNGHTYFCFVKQQLYQVPIPCIQNILYRWARIALDIAVGTM